MSYRVKGATFDHVGLASSAACVVANDRNIGALDAAYAVGATARTPAWEWATESGGHLRPSSAHHLGALVALSDLGAGTLAELVAGGAVIISDGTNQWRRATVMFDGTKILVGGSVIPIEDTPAYIVGASSVPATLPAKVLQAVSEAADESTWFGLDANTPIFHCGPKIGVVDLAPGDVAIVPIGGALKMVRI